MIRSHYALPEEDRGANAVRLLSCDLVSWRVACEPGTATLDGGVPDPETFVADPELRTSHQQVADPAGFVVWYADDPSQRNPADNEVQQLATGLLYYLWLQRKGLLGG